MRTIKFRAWIINEKVMLKDIYSLPSYWEDDQDEVLVMQYTGLKDKNGKESFESDIAQDFYGGICVIEWNYTLLSHLEDIDFEVIGNIHENPELL